MTQDQLKRNEQVQMAHWCIQHDELDFTRDYFREKDVTDYVFYTDSGSNLLHVKALLTHVIDSFMLYYGMALQEFRSKKD